MPLRMFIKAFRTTMFALTALVGGLCIEGCTALQPQAPATQSKSIPDTVREYYVFMENINGPALAESEPQNQGTSCHHIYDPHLAAYESFLDDGETNSVQLQLDLLARHVEDKTPGCADWLLAAKINTLTAEYLPYLESVEEDELKPVMDNLLELVVLRNSHATREKIVSPYPLLFDYQDSACQGSEHARQLALVKDWLTRRARAIVSSEDNSFKLGPETVREVATQMGPGEGANRYPYFMSVDGYNAFKSHLGASDDNFHDKVIAQLNSDTNAALQAFAGQPE